MTTTRMNKKWRRAIKSGEYICCHICKFPIMLGGNPSLGHLTCDHVIPKALGGKDAPWNYKPAHKKCNLFKGSTLHYTPTTKHLNSIEKMIARMCPEAA